ncbi:dephospho-CoA kinase [Frankia sp. AgKG'84/4]|uniref:dephospho-CoA kinase n=1 Tax=Frankia sp. AgKG'84/4 TaxID=573490 RepID=UPI00200E4DC4|nr:dephospho-CoA kinase [Frankia sp. AgKG'84/4]MCL9794685.1 dephospho-CoA kinase [Frankia sp. AgKG'84/4]
MGLTGGIGSGKSAVSARLEGRGATVIDADRIAREVVAPGTPGLAAVLAAFGPAVAAPDGSLDRPALGRVVFADPAARARLEAIVHPLIRARTQQRIAGLDPDGIAVHDIPLLVETGAAGSYDLVLVVEAPRELRLERLAGRGLPRDEALARMSSQASDEQRRAVADVVIDNGGDLADLDTRVAEVWRELEARREAKAAADAAAEHPPV